MKSAYLYRVLGVALACSIGSATASAVTITDDFSDGDYTNNPAWTVETGTLSVVDEELQFNKSSNASISLDIPGIADNSTAQIDLDLKNNHGFSGSLYFDVVMTDTSSGNSAILRVTQNTQYFGTSGIAILLDNGVANPKPTKVGPANVAFTGDSGFHHVSFSFDPSNGVTATFAGQSFSMGTQAGFEMQKVDQIKLSNGNALITWSVDNVNFVSPIPEPGSFGLLSLGGILMLRRRSKQV